VNAAVPSAPVARDVVPESVAPAGAAPSAIVTASPCTAAPAASASFTVAPNGVPAQATPGCDVNVSLRWGAGVLPEDVPPPPHAASATQPSAATTDGTGRMAQ
jgi:hypothetical protein